MFHKIMLALFALVAGFSSPCMGQIDARTYPVIPIPQKIQAQKGQFEVTAKTLISADVKDPQIDWVIQYLNGHLQTRMGWTLATSKSGKKSASAIYLKLLPGTVKPESYRLTIDSKETVIEGGDLAGLFYGVQSLIQLLPDGDRLILPGLTVEDHPAFPYRGMHLDVGRHFFPVAFVKQYIDMLARYKMNRFHWHLTEDQGWRIEIKRYPKLQEVGAYRKETLIGHYGSQAPQYDGKRYGGFYTQEEIKEIVRYAQERFVTIVPEIELPGHAQAAIAAYPELGCTGKPVEVATQWGVFENVYCPSEATFEFLQNVLTEVMQLFPGKYIHIGGDECPKTQWKGSPVAQELIRKEGLKNEEELQSYFIRRIEKFLNANGRDIIGWDEILEGGLAPNATVMSWRGIEGGIEAAKQKHSVIMTPVSHCYFDYYQALHPEEPLAIGGFLPLEKVYSYDPIPDELSPEEAKYILGAQGNLWTEYIPDSDKAEYMAYPRMQALSEVVWSGEEKKNFPGFIQRLLVHLPRLEKEGITVANHLFDVNASVKSGDGKGVRVVLNNLAQTGVVRYTRDGSSPKAVSPAVDGDLPVNSDGNYRGRTFLEGTAIGREAGVQINLHYAAGRSISLATPPAKQYSGSGPGALINGVNGDAERFNDGEWLGFQGTDFEAVIDFGEPISFRKLVFRFFNSPQQWIYPPREVIVSTANFPEQFGQESQTRLVPPNAWSGKQLQSALIYNTKARFLKIKIPNFGIIPDGYPGAGKKAWLFVDEIVVE